MSQSCVVCKPMPKVCEWITYEGQTEKHSPSVDCIVDQVLHGCNISEEELTKIIKPDMVSEFIAEDWLSTPYEFDHDRRAAELNTKALHSVLCRYQYVLRLIRAGDSIIGRFVAYLWLCKQQSDGATSAMCDAIA